MAKRDSTPVICWGVLPLDSDMLNTQSQMLPTFRPPTDPVGFVRGQQKTSGMGTEGGVGMDGGVDTHPRANAMVGIDVSLTRLLN